MSANSSMPAPQPSAAEFRYDAFISYSHQDGPWVIGVLLPRLEQAGIRVCIDTRDFDIGLPVLVNIENAIQQSRVTLLVLTPDWVASEWATFEGLLLQFSDPTGRRRRILPLLVRDCTPPDRLRIFTYLDLRSSADFETQLARLLATLRATTGSRVPTSPPTQPAPPPVIPISREFSYDAGLQRLGERLDAAETETRLAFSVLEARLRDNLRREQIYGSSESVRHDRAEVIEQLNRLALTHAGATFNELCALPAG